MNQSVQVFMRGCLTLKFSASWKTVLISPSKAALVEPCVLASLEVFSDGEMGIVSNGTCWLGFGAVATSAIVVDGDMEAEKMWGCADSERNCERE